MRKTVFFFVISVLFTLSCVLGVEEKEGKIASFHYPVYQEPFLYPVMPSAPELDEETSLLENSERSQLASSFSPIPSFFAIEFPKVPPHSPWIYRESSSADEEAQKASPSASTVLALSPKGFGYSQRSEAEEQEMILVSRQYLATLENRLAALEDDHQLILRLLKEGIHLIKDIKYIQKFLYESMEGAGRSLSNLTIKIGTHNQEVLEKSLEIVRMSVSAVAAYSAFKAAAFFPLSILPLGGTAPLLAVSTGLWAFGRLKG